MACEAKAVARASAVGAVPAALDAAGTGGGRRREVWFPSPALASRSRLVSVIRVPRGIESRLELARRAHQHDRAGSLPLYFSRSVSFWPLEKPPRPDAGGRIRATTPWESRSTGWPAARGSGRKTFKRPSAAKGSQGSRCAFTNPQAARDSLVQLLARFRLGEAVRRGPMTSVR